LLVAATDAAPAAHALEGLAFRRIRGRRDAADVDYGAYSSPLTEFANEAPRIEAITVDGQKAKLVSTAGMTAVHVPATGARQALTVIVRYSDEGVQPQALQIVRAIRFTTTN